MCVACTRLERLSARESTVAVAVASPVSSFVTLPRRGMWGLFSSAKTCVPLTSWCPFSS